MSSENNIRWRILPITEERGKTIVFIVAVVVILAGIHVSFGEWWLTLLATLFLLGSLRMFWSPTWYIVSPDGVVVKSWFYRVTHKWERFRAVKDDVRGLVLSPFKSDSRLENYRALFLRLPPAQPDLKRQVRESCERYLGFTNTETIITEGSKE